MDYKPPSNTFTKKMRASTIIPLLLLTFCALAGAAPGDHSGGDRKWLIEGSCGLIAAFDGRVPKEYCVSTLANAPFDDKAKRSLHGLAWISLNLLDRNVSATKAKIDILSHSPEVLADPKVREVMAKCSSMYSEATHRSREAVKYVNANNYMFADRTVSMVQGDGSECETAFKYENLPSPVTKENLDCTYLSAMTTLLIRFFDKSYTPWGEAIIKKNLG